MAADRGSRLKGQARMGAPDDVQEPCERILDPNGTASPSPNTRWARKHATVTIGLLAFEFILGVVP